MGILDDFINTIKGQRDQFKAEQKKAAKKAPEGKPSDYGYVGDVDAYLKSGGKIEVKGVTAAMDPYMYDIYTSQGCPVGQARYYRQENVIVSLVPDPFAKYRK
jgi:hypothetical protein